MSRTTQEELQKRLQEARQRIDIEATYFHYKDTDRTKPYKIVTIALNESSEEPCVVYQAQYGENLTWIRTITDFTAEVTTNEGTVTRFSQ